MATIVANAGAAGNWTDGAAWVGGVAPTAADDAQITVTTTSITIDSGAVCRSADFTGFTGVLTHNAVTFNIGDGTAGLGNIALVFDAAMTYTKVNAISSAITFRSTSATQQSITTAGKVLGNFVINGAGSSYILVDNLTSSGNSFTYTAGTTFDMVTNTTTVTLTAATVTINPTIALTFYNLTRIPTTPVKTNTLTLSGDITVVNTFTVSNGATVTNRVLVTSNTLGTARTITSAINSIENADFQDITGAGAASWNLAAITGLSGDCGGNSGITFTTPTTQTATGTASFTWSTHGWTSHVPLPQDDVVVNNSFIAGRTVTCDMPRLGKNIDFTGATGTPTVDFSTTTRVFGSLTLIPDLAAVSGSASIVTLSGRSNFTFTPGLSVWGALFSQAAFGGSYVLQGDFSSSQANTCDITAGTFDMNDNDVTVTSFAMNGTLTRSILMKSGTLTCTSGTGSPFTISSATGLTFDAGTSTLKYTDTSNSNLSMSIFNSGIIFYNIWFSRGASTGSITVAPAITCNNLKDDGTAAHSLLFPAGFSMTFNTFTVLGNGAGNEITIDSAAGSTNTHSLIKLGGGTISCDYLNIQHSVATPGNAWYAGIHSINNQAVASAGSGWIFNAPSGANFLMFM